MNLDAQLVVNKLAAKLAQAEANNAVLEATIETLKAEKKEEQEKEVK
ncbi:hypothetical protein QS460_04885 [Liquorilactobacillus mali]|nr:hypothetical protein [Liquorilactobacillus mali]MDN7145259.1 hypothetical protein [Liquorilactobacillus mali]